MVSKQENDRYKPNSTILSERNRMIIKTFAEKMHKMQAGQAYDVIGSHLSHFTGTRSGFNSKAKSYRDQVIKSIAKHLPFDDYKEASVTEQTTTRDGESSARGRNTDLNTARREGSLE